MKPILLLIFCLLTFNFAFAQVPQAFSYKMQVKDNNGVPRSNKKINLKISIIQENIDGNAVYIEKHQVTTSIYGIVDIEIGRGEALLGLFSEIDWKNWPYFVKAELDLKCGGNYNLLAVTELLTVPYAMYAGNAANGFSGDYNDLQNKPVIPTNLSELNNDMNFINLETDPVFNSSLAKGITETDTAYWNAKSDFNGDYNNLSNKPVIPTKTSELENNSGFITVEADGDPANELQVLSISNDTIWLSRGGFVKLPSGTANAWDFDAKNNVIKNLADPVAAKDAANKAYVDDLQAGSEEFNQFLLGITNEYWKSENSGLLRDIDGNLYKIKALKFQDHQYPDLIWMTQDLRVSRYSDGRLLKKFGSGGTSHDLQFAKRYTFYNKDTILSLTYGFLYNYEAAIDLQNDLTLNEESQRQGICPVGWHIPNNTELEQMTRYMDAGYLKEKGFLHWKRPNIGANNLSGFSALPGGKFYPNFCELGESANYWVVNEYTEGPGKTIGTARLVYNYHRIEMTNGRNILYASIRCVKDHSSRDNDHDGYSIDKGDCNDSDKTICPDCPEICGDGIDQDCDGTDMDCDMDKDGDGIIDTRDNCPEIGNTDQLDSDGDGIGDACTDKDKDNYTMITDCNDNDASIHPGATEICGDSIDQDCNGSDLACPQDVDNDGDGFTENQNDCNDADHTIYPGATEICGDGIDQDCNGSDLACDGNTDSDGDGIINLVEDLNGDGNFANDDSDGDGIPNYLDLDDDNDGINTIDEGILDWDADGVPNYLESNISSLDNDTSYDAVDTDDDGDGVNTIIEGSFNKDFDKDGTPDFRDTDSDNDGLPDGEEDVNGNGIVDYGDSDRLNPDTDGDGVIDGSDNCPFTPNPNQEDADGNGKGDVCNYQFVGHATYYYNGALGACSYPEGFVTDLYAAVNQQQYDRSGLCGACLNVYGPKGNVMVKVMDLCSDCGFGNLDLSPEAFTQIADLETGNVRVFWEVVPCPIASPVQFYFKPESSVYWTAIMILNHKNTISKLEIFINNHWIELTRSDYNYFIGENLGSGPFHFRITDIYSNVIEEPFIPFLPGQVVNGTKQF